MTNDCHFMFCHDRRNHFRLFSWDAVFVQKGRHVLCEIGYFCKGMIAFHGPYIVTSDAFLTSFATNRKKKMYLQ